ncbi:hypothetical protein [Chryseobacterium sp. CH21]|uniref:hypothetical protein n=1 Tax=Chryseobacterium sp. CH21 TaxID=713556 RepID=UPI001E3F9BF7|nr:hypothetical protein [Chryseobacterium sp. CH21]
MKTSTKKKNLTKDSIWMKKPEDHDFPAALDYLDLLFEPDEAQKMVEKLKSAPPTQKNRKIS